LLPKPESCKGCPLYQSGHGFVPDEVRPGAPVMILGQNPGEEEEHAGQPFIGKTGQLQESKFMPLAGVTRADCSVGNAIRCRWMDSNELPPLDSSAFVKEAVEHCTRAHLRVPEGTRVILATGAYSLYALTGHGALKNDRISDWRGWMLPRAVPGVRLAEPGIYHPAHGDVPVIGTVHIAAIFRDALLQHPAKYDWTRVAKYLAGKWPERMPAIDFNPPATWPARAAFDTEFVPETGKLIRYSVAWRDASGEPHVHVVDGESPSAVPCDGHPVVIMHSTDADIDYLEQILPGGFEIEDTMHKHAVLWSDFEHTLDYLGSIYGRINRWKHLFRTSPLVYSGGDALGTWDVDVALNAEFQRDPRSEWVYRNLQLPQVHVIRRANRIGLRVNQAHVPVALEELERRCEDAEAQAQAACGWPINIASGPQMMHRLYQIEQLHSMARHRK